MADPRLSVVIPIYNEEGILSSSIAGLREGLDQIGRSYEIILAENGSTDGTREILAGLAARVPEVRWQSTPEPNYGRALKQGILSARGEIVICDEIDICDAAFHRTALDLLDSGRADLVIGSKLASGAQDRRPLFRHSASLVYNAVLRVLLGFHGTDTHGLKAFRRTALLDVTHACTTDRDVFASELVIRAERGGVRIVEVPVRIAEKRPPSINLVKRVPHVLGSLGRLFASIRLGS
ncbi:MAG: glycosyltransferase [Deltaproteobacteria bacterium]|nr:glycosyltransferase [Deltaproteobacteria bacterium]